MKMEIEVAVPAGELSRHPDIVNGIILPQLEPEVHTGSCNDSDDDSGNDFDHDGEPVSHLYPFMCQIHPRVSLVTPAPRPPFWNRNPMVMFS